MAKICSVPEAGDIKSVRTAFNHFVHLINSASKLLVLYSLVMYQNTLRSTFNLIILQNVV